MMNITWLHRLIYLFIYSLKLKIKLYNQTCSVYEYVPRICHFFFHHSHFISVKTMSEYLGVFSTFHTALNIYFSFVTIVHTSSMLDSIKLY